MSLINVSNLTFGYDGSEKNIFENVSFQIDTNWKLGLTGRNGRGKTTFFKLLLNEYEYSGTITSDVSFEYFPFSVRDESLYTIDILNEICPDVPEWKIIKEVSLLDADCEVLYRPMETLSNGEKTKALLAALFLKKNNFLLIDEPTNHLDYTAREAVSSYLNKKKGFILNSHDRAFLDSCIDHIISINKTNIDIQKGNFESWFYNKQLNDNYETAQNELLKKDIKRLEAAAKRTETWSNKKEASKFGSKAGRGYIGHKAAKMSKRSNSIKNRRVTAIEEKSSLMKNIETNGPLKLTPLKFHNTQLVVLKNVSVYYGNKSACSDISLTIEQGDRIAVRGKNGSGKTSILKLIKGENIEYTGDIIKNPALKISYISQNSDFLEGSLDDYANDLDIDTNLFKAILRKLDFSRDLFEKNMKTYSDGQKKKVLIAGSLCEKAHLYIWDEPLNYIDVISRIQLEELILNYSPTLIFVEHDKAFTDKIATKSLEF